MADAVLGGANESGLLVEERFEHGFGIANGHADTQREEQGQVGDFLPPRAGPQRLLRHQIEQHHRNRREKENRHVDDIVAVLAEVRMAVLVGIDQEAQANEHQIGKVGGQVGGGLHFDEEGHVGPPDGGQDFFAHLDGTLGPAVLLALEAVHIDRQFGRGFHVIEENEAPALELGAVAEVHVLGEGVMLPAARIGDAGFAPDAAGAVESEEASRAIARGLLEFEVAVEEHRLNAGEHVEGAVEVAPTGLNQADAFVGEIVDGFLQQVRIGDKIGIEDEQVLALGSLGAVFQRAGLVAGAVAAVDVLGVEAASPQARDAAAADFHGLVGGIIQQLDLDLVQRVIQRGDRIEQAIDDVHFVEDGELDGDQRQLGEMAEGMRVLAGVFEVEENDGQTVRAIAGKAEQDNNVAKIPNGRGPVHESEGKELIGETRGRLWLGCDTRNPKRNGAGEVTEDKVGRPRRPETAWVVKRGLFGWRIIWQGLAGWDSRASTGGDSGGGHANPGGRRRRRRRW